MVDAPTLSQRRVWHFLEMLLAMSAGMLLVAPLWSVPADRADLHVLTMTTDMTAGMVVWTVLRRQPWSHLATMAGAMWAPFLLLLVPYHLGAIDADTLVAGGHVLMLPSMFVVSRTRGALPTRSTRSRRPVSRTSAAVPAR